MTPPPAPIAALIDAFVEKKESETEVVQVEQVEEEPVQTEVEIRNYFLFIIKF